MSPTSINRRLRAVSAALHSAEEDAKILLSRYGRRYTTILLPNRDPHLFLRRSRAALAPLKWAYCIESSPRVLDLRNAATALSEIQRTELYDAEKRRSRINYTLSALRSEYRRLQEYERLIYELPQPVTMKQSTDLAGTDT